MSLAHVRQIAPWYITWVRENRPEMLKDHSPKKSIKPAPPRIEPPEENDAFKIVPNMAFDNEGPN